MRPKAIARPRHWLLVSLMLLAPGISWAAWSTDPLVNLPVCTATGVTGAIRACPDGAGGAFVVWQDRRNGTDYDLYVHHVRAGGDVDPAWPVQGLAICLAAEDQGIPQIIEDGSGGAFVTWSDSRDPFTDATNVYVTHVLAAGSIAAGWAAGGVAICTFAEARGNSQVALDGEGGVIVVWEDARSGTIEVYAQRVRSTGSVLPVWPVNGRLFPQDGLAGTQPKILPDGLGGAIVAYMVQHAVTLNDIRAHHVNKFGVIDAAWPATGVDVCTETGNQGGIALISDGAGGAIVGWPDYRGGATSDLYAHRVLAGGTLAAGWPTNGRALCTASGTQFGPEMVADGSGGAIATWQDVRGASGDIYAQRVLADGSLAGGWPTDGLPVCIAGNNQLGQSIASDGAGGAIISWHDFRTETNIYAMRVLPGGATDPAWRFNGLAVCTASGQQFSPKTVATGTGGVIVAWFDRRNSVDGDVYAQRVRGDGVLGDDPVTSVPGPGLSGGPVLLAEPNPARGESLHLRFTLSGGESARLDLFDFSGRRVGSLEVGSWGSGSHSALFPRKAGMPPGIYLARLTQGSIESVAKIAWLDP